MKSRKTILILTGVLIAAVIIGYSWKTFGSGSAFKLPSKKENKG